MLRLAEVVRGSISISAFKDYMQGSQKSEFSTTCNSFRYLRANKVGPQKNTTDLGQKQNRTSAAPRTTSLANQRKNPAHTKLKSLVRDPGLQVVPKFGPELNQKWRRMSKVTHHFCN